MLWLLLHHILMLLRRWRSCLRLCIIERVWFTLNDHSLCEWLLIAGSVIKFWWLLRNSAIDFDADTCKVRFLKVPIPLFLSKIGLLINIFSHYFTRQRFSKTVPALTHKNASSDASIEISQFVDRRLRSSFLSFSSSSSSLCFRCFFAALDIFLAVVVFIIQDCFLIEPEGRSRRNNLK